MLTNVKSREIAAGFGFDCFFIETSASLSLRKLEGACHKSKGGK
jgi:hypothetical protein